MTTLIKLAEVLETLKTLGTAPKPFPQSAQYKSNFNKDTAHADPDPDAPELEASKVPSKSTPKGKKKPRATIKNAKMKKGPPAKSTDVSAAKSTDVSAASSEDVYQPHEYSRLRKEFIKAKKDSGLSGVDANEAWNQSQQKRKLLAGVSVTQLRRRRFIEKGCNHNPWAS